MAATPWVPWHKALALRDDLRTGELSLAVFAADLYDVVMGKARRVYQDPAEFFALTYPTYNLRELAKDVCLRLAGKTDRAIRQLELTYGGGKTHSLITLHHLVSDPTHLPRIPAVDEFVQHIGMEPPRARVAVLAFDKLDVEKGMEVCSPSGERRWLRTPWGVLAYQLAGDDGLKALHAEDQAEERESAPAENLLEALLALPGREGLSTLVLLDEVLMYAREKVGLDPAWRGRLQNFFQYLTQAATKVDRCAVVASLLATDPSKSDELGRELTREMYATFRREREEGVQPVLQEDVAEVLRRRFFAPESLQDRESFKKHAVAALQGIAALDEDTRKAGPSAEDRYVRSYPFHPDLTDVFYSKWTSLEGFQRTRGILRTFALALRAAETWDDCPLIAANVFLPEPGQAGVSEAARELTTVAGTEETEGKKQEWTAILEGELGRAREVQAEFPSLAHRELEQAVFGVFLHSQPIGQKAQTRELNLLLGHTRPDRIEIEKALVQWAGLSWWLDDEPISEAVKDGRGMPKWWRLGTKPNLRQMHHDACLRVGSLVEGRLLDEIGKAKRLTEGASAAGAKVHSLPEKPRDVGDEGEFHYVLLGPSAAAESGRPSAEARRFVEETTGPDRPRVYRNAVVLAVPSRDGLEAARARVKDHLGWLEVENQLKQQDLDPVRAEQLRQRVKESEKAIRDTIEQAYCIVVTVSDANEVQAFRLQGGDGALFARIKADPRSRIRDTAVSADALLPGGPYDLWAEGDLSRRVRDLTGMFAQVPRLPKMLGQREILETLLSGVRDGAFVLRLPRPDGTARTYWREVPEPELQRDPGLELVLPEAAELTDLPTPLLSPGLLPGVWLGTETTYGKLSEYFSGSHTVPDAYGEPIAVPRVSPEVLEAAVSGAVQSGKLWLVSGPTSLCGEDVPAGILTDNALLRTPPRPIPANDVLPASIPTAWTDGASTAEAILDALSAKVEGRLPWRTVRDAIDGALRAGIVQHVADSGAWPCELAEAGRVDLRLPAQAPPRKPDDQLRPKGTRTAKAQLKSGQIQDLADRVADITKAAAGMDIRFTVTVELGGDSSPAPEAVERLQELLGDISADFKLE